MPTVTHHFIPAASGPFKPTPAVTFYNTMPAVSCYDISYNTMPAVPAVTKYNTMPAALGSDTSYNIMPAATSYNIKPGKCSPCEVWDMPWAQSIIFYNIMPAGGP
jgi:hypothetical protein